VGVWTAITSLPLPSREIEGKTYNQMQTKGKRERLRREIQKEGGEEECQIAEGLQTNTSIN
jgi:hypothetical protein